jgi:hypothetical protein
MKKKRFTMLLTEDEIWEIKERAAQARLTATDWALAQFKLTAKAEPIRVVKQDQDDTQAQQKAEIRKRDLQILEIEKKYPGPANAQARVDELNRSGVLKRGKAGEWNKTSAKNAILSAKKNLGVK